MTTVTSTAVTTSIRKLHFALHMNMSKQGTTVVTTVASAAGTTSLTKQDTTVVTTVASAAGTKSPRKLCFALHMTMSKQDTTVVTTVASAAGTTSLHVCSNGTWNTTATTVASSGLNTPIGFYLDKIHQIMYITDYGNNRVLQWTVGQPSGTVIAAFHSITGVAVDSTGNVYTSDSNLNTILKFPPGSDETTVGMVVDTVSGPQNLFVDTNDDLYVSDTYNSRVLKYPQRKTPYQIVAGNGTVGSDLNTLNFPIGVYVDPSGNLYVTDYGNNRVLRFPPGSSNTTNGTVVASGLNGPRDTIVDQCGTIYVTDSGSKTVQRWLAGASSGDTILGTIGTSFSPEGIVGS
ncbi:unnamed protein product [Didymodactylos carnosus]|uniref:NHL repeat-containing protein n=1 Tax=Didymodactylos carnosus TaxID=1234261 RepID=A0A8S2DBP0_9BILA|nr:unnamed protein product [Didymodactylos carnosus]CAF3641913.1 unnamed protein product [Didymodactylos carnosus]